MRFYLSNSALKLSFGFLFLGFFFPPRKWAFRFRWWSGGFESRYFYVEPKSSRITVALLSNSIFCSFYKIFSVPVLCRCLYHLLDSGTGLVTSRCVLSTVWRPGLREIFPSARRVQLRHEPHHLLLPRQGDERHLPADPLLPAQRRRQRPRGRLWPLGFLPQPHHLGRSSQQWPLCGLEGRPRGEASRHGLREARPPLPRCQGKVGSEREGKKLKYLNTNQWQYSSLDPTRPEIRGKLAYTAALVWNPIPFQSRKWRSCNGIHKQTPERPFRLH